MNDGMSDGLLGEAGQAVGMDIAHDFSPSRQTAVTTRQGPIHLKSSDQASGQQSRQSELSQSHGSREFHRTSDKNSQSYLNVKPQNQSRRRTSIGKKTAQNSAAPSMMFDESGTEKAPLMNSHDNRLTAPHGYPSDMLKQTVISQNGKSTMSQAPTNQRSLMSRMQDYINRKVNVTRQELFATQDVNIVTKKRMRIYTISNLVCFLLEILVFGTVQWVDKINTVVLFYFNQQSMYDLPLVPMQMQAEVETLGWVIVILLQAIFVLRGLPCLSPGQHYVNCLLLKIKFSFCLLCLSLTASIFCFASLYNYQNLTILIIPFILFILLKLCIHFLIYQPLKYKDDGRDVVSFLDFITIHCTFPAINAWVSYQMYYSILITVPTSCETQYIKDLDTSICDKYGLYLRDLKQQRLLDPTVRDTFWYGYMMIPSFIAYSLLFVEASINLTYYKDCVFMLTVLSMFIGMLVVNYPYKGNEQLVDSQEWNDQSRVIVLASASDSVQNDADRICQYLFGFAATSMIWILVTLVTDWNSVFYRKAIIYKKRVDDELAVKRNRVNQSFTSGSVRSHQLNDGASSHNDNGTIVLAKSGKWPEAFPTQTNHETLASKPTEISGFVDTQQLIRAQKEQISRLMPEEDQMDKTRSGSFGAYKNYQNLISNMQNSEDDQMRTSQHMPANESIRLTSLPSFQLIGGQGQSLDQSPTLLKFRSQPQGLPPQEAQGGELSSGEKSNHLKPPRDHAFYRTLSKPQNHGSGSPGMARREKDDIYEDKTRSRQNGRISSQQAVKTKHITGQGSTANAQSSSGGNQTCMQKSADQDQGKGLQNPHKMNINRSSVTASSNFQQQFAGIGSMQDDQYSQLRLSVKNQAQTTNQGIQQLSPATPGHNESPERKGY